MPATLITGAAGQGKTRAAIEQVKKLKRLKPFGRVWVLLPTDLQINTFRAHLLDELGESFFFGVEFFEFYELYARLLEIAGQPQQQIVDAARFRILREVLTAFEQDLAHFSRIAHLPGFVELMARFIEELKQAEIKPEDFRARAPEIPKNQDLGAIYTGYQTFLQEHDLVDRDGSGWLALALLDKSSEILPAASLPEMLIVDGYDQFNLVQARLLARLSERLSALGRNTILTLTYQPERAETAHRRFAQTRKRLLDIYSGWREKPVETPASAGSPVLTHLTARLFDTYPESISNDGALQMIEAPDRRRETQTILRKVKRLLLEGRAPEQIAILGRDLTAYAPYFLEIAPAYGIPLATGRGSPLVENPAVGALLGLIRLPANDFPRRATIDALHSPYLDSPFLSFRQIGALDRVSRGRVVVRGRENWLEAIQNAGNLQADENGDLPVDALSPEEAEALYNGVEDFFARITPPAQATARAFVRWIEGVIGLDPTQVKEWRDEEEPLEIPTTSFNLIRRIRAGRDRDIVARDLAAIQCFKGVLQGVLSAYELIDPARVIAWEVFWLDLEIAVENAAVKQDRTMGRGGQVLLATVFEARGLPHDHLFVIGLAEGEFPARTPEDPLYMDWERRQMKDRELPLRTRAEEADESSLFYEITALARQSLTLSRPYIDDKGDEWPASPYWRAVQAVIAGVEVERTPIAAMVSVDDAAQPSEAILALAQGLNTSGSPDADVLCVYGWLAKQSDLAPRWTNALIAREIELGRDSAAEHDEHTGWIRDPALVKVIGELLGPERIWSASQFDEYGTCPYKFFARRLLRLEALEEPEEGMNQLQHGSLLHEALEMTYRQIGAEGLEIIPANTERALAIFDEVMRHTLSTAPIRHGFRATPLWEQEQRTLYSKLRSLIAKDFSADSPVNEFFEQVLNISLAARGRSADAQELAFGNDGNIVIGGPAGPLKVRGKIDRVDEVNGRVVVVDYKSGNTAIPTDEMVMGRRIQMMLYILVAGQLFADKSRTVSGGMYWHIGSQKQSGRITTDDPQIETARQSLHERIIEGRQGIFVSVPSKLTEGRCARYCPYSQLCRVNRQSDKKALTPNPSGNEQ